MHTLVLLLSLLQSPPDDLFKTVAALDTALFDAYNKCDLEKFASLLADDLEFYHDATGLSRGAQATVDAVKQNICGKVHRDLVPGTLKVYPLKGYGALETGIHLFCDPKKSKCPDGSDVGRFTMLCEFRDGVWMLTRVISYDHCNGCSLATAPDFRK
jgi:ketosteroid isomerase-like protein